MCRIEPCFILKPQCQVLTLSGIPESLQGWPLVQVSSEDGEPSSTHGEKSGSTTNSSSRNESQPPRFQPEQFFPPPATGA